MDHLRKITKENELKNTTGRIQWNVRFQTEEDRARFLDTLEDYRHALKKRGTKAYVPDALELALTMALGVIAGDPASD